MVITVLTNTLHSSLLPSSKEASVRDKKVERRSSFSPPGEHNTGEATRKVMRVRDSRSYGEVEVNLRAC